ncbi:MAG: hypothetical protein IMZ53_06930, partial [Thermoplasmata archaeon]|nr:hypothetical protein [Thermoplasmata archaeon]
MGVMDSIDNALQNKLLLQYMSGVGASIAEGKGLAPGANAITQQNIESQNMMKLMSRLLGPDGTKATISNAGINMTFPTKEAAAMLQGNSSGATLVNPVAPVAGAPALAPVAPAPASMAPAPISVQGGGSVAPNPFVGNIPAADLAGLTSQDISTALGMKMKMSELSSEMPYKQALTNQAIAATIENTPSVDINVGGTTMKVTPKDAIAYRKMERETSPEKMKLYNVALAQGYKGNIVDFMNADMTGHQKDYEKVKAEGKYKGDFNSWLTDQAKA